MHTNAASVRCSAYYGYYGSRALAARPDSRGSSADRSPSLLLPAGARGSGEVHGGAHAGTALGIAARLRLGGISYPAYRRQHGAAHELSAKPGAHRGADAGAARRGPAARVAPGGTAGDLGEGPAGGRGGGARDRSRPDLGAARGRTEEIADDRNRAADPYRGAHAKARRPG